MKKDFISYIYNNNSLNYIEIIIKLFFIKRAIQKKCILGLQINKFYKKVSIYPKYCRYTN